MTPINHENQIGLIVNKLDSHVIKKDLISYMMGCIVIYLLVIGLYWGLHKVFKLKKKLLFNVNPGTS